MADKGDTRLSNWLKGTLSEKETIELSQEYDLAYLQSILDRQSKLDISTSPSNVLWKNFVEKRSKVTKTQGKRISILSRRNTIVVLILAIGAILALLLWISKSNHETTIRTKKGETLEYAMKDGTSIYLSPDSNITYDSTSWESKRILHLEGQAFFQVERGSSFQVHADAGVISVLGTAFDVWSQNRSNLKVSCQEGQVSVSNSHNEVKTLSAGKGVNIVNNEFSEIISLGIERANWMDGKKTYRSTEVFWIVQDLERYHDIKVRIDAELKEKRFSGVIPIQELEKALDFLTKTMGWKYEINQKYITISAV